MASTLAELMRGSPQKVLSYGGFQCRHAESEGELEDAYRLRHRVFSEAGYIEAAAFPDGRFRDAFDDVSAQLLVFGPGDELVGSTRFVLPSERGYVTEQLFNIEPPPINRQRLGEFGRLAIDSRYRGGERIPMLGLLTMVYWCMRENQIEWVYAFLPPRLIDSYAALGCVSRPLKEREATAEFLERRNPMRSYFAKQEIRPVLFELSQMLREIGV